MERLGLPAADIRQLFLLTGATVSWRQFCSTFSLEAGQQEEHLSSAKARKTAKAAQGFHAQAKAKAAGAQGRRLEELALSLAQADVLKAGPPWGQ